MTSEQSFNVDYYSLLGVSRNSSKEEITRAFRKLARIFHPDKISDPQQKREAEQRFNDLKEAFDVLTNDGLRAVYDVYGVQGVKSTKQLSHKLKTPSEFLRQFDKERQKEEDDYIQRRVNLQGEISVHTSATEIVNFVTGQKMFLSIPQMSIYERVKVPITDSTEAFFQGHIRTQNGQGFGGVGFHLRKAFGMNTTLSFDSEFGTGGQLFQLNGFRKLGAFTEGHIAAGWAPLRGTFLDIAASRALTPRTHLVWGWTQGLRQSMRFGFVVDDSQIKDEQDQLVQKLTTEYSVILETQPNEIGIVCRGTKEVDKRTSLKGSLRLTTKSFSLSYGIARRISDLSRFILGLRIGIESGLTLIFGFTRLGQRFMFPIQLTDILNPLNVLICVFTHGMINFLLKSLVFDVVRQWKKQKKLQALRQENLEFLNEQKKRAESFVRLMKVTVEQKREREEKRKGLIISHASYGKLPQTNPEKPGEPNLDEDEENNPYVIDVTIPLMFLVENSRLQLPATTKVGLMGFYDPCPGEEKWLEVIYYFKEKLHRVCIRDDEPLEIPLESHAWGWTPANVKK